MQIKNLKKNFIKHCKKNKFEVNNRQIEIIELLMKFYLKNFSSKSFISNIFSNKKNKLGFYLHGDVGVGKTMLLNFFFNSLNVKKKRIHFNEFMISYHDFAHKNKKKQNSLTLFVKDIKKKYDLLYFDEFQVTNIVDAMILGRLFDKLFNENIKILVTSNIQIEELYKDGLQRKQFLPFIDIFKRLCIEQKLIIDTDYRKSNIKNLDYFFHPIDSHTKFVINQIFRKLTKEKKSQIKKIKIKGREFKIKSYFEGIARFNFKELCNQNIGAEDYIKIADQCSFIIIEEIPDFNDQNINQQHRFITLIDIIYEKKIALLVSANRRIEDFSSSKKLLSPFKRTLSRIYELTSKVSK